MVWPMQRLRMVVTTGARLPSPDELDRTGRFFQCFEQVLALFMSPLGRKHQHHLVSPRAG
jgi:hypothetical protein